MGRSAVLTDSWLTGWLARVCKCVCACNGVLPPGDRTIVLPAPRRVQAPLPFSPMQASSPRPQAPSLL